MKIEKSYLKTQLLLARVYAVSFVTITLASCSGENGKFSVNHPNNPAETYKSYLADIRKQDNLSFTDLSERIRQWQCTKDSVFTPIRKDTLNPGHSELQEQCTRLHDSIRIEFSRLTISKPRTYQELLTLKKQFSPYNEDEELHRTAKNIRPFFIALDKNPVCRGNRQQILSMYRALLAETIRDGIHDHEDLMTYIKKEDAVFRAFLSHLHDLGDMNTIDITHDTERCCSQIFLAAKRKEITYQEAMIYLAMRTNRRQIQNMKACIDDVRNKKIKTPLQAQAYIWMLVQPYTSLDGFCMALLSDKEKRQLDRIAAQTPATFKILSQILQLESKRLDELPGMLMEVFIHTL